MNKSNIRLSIHKSNTVTNQFFLILIFIFKKKLVIETHQTVLLEIQVALSRY